ncbi:helix-turn-helix transcriptional regulator [Corynebacterium provencense]|uniref:helix-turn-helix transcriptional regulator n=1 Tax=Corynebacterium provencense TaxID=1737425 RepID=UPI00082FB643|nr:helix-turn-helix domain-containing protein [Corynebacterium provencense]
MADNTAALLDTADLAEYLGIPEVTLRTWRHRGLGPRHFKLGRKSFYKATDVEEWLTNAYETTGTAQQSA